MTRVIFLVSGGGGNLKFLNEAIKLLRISDLSICGVIADRDCPAASYSLMQSIPVHIIRYSQNNPIELQTILDSHEPDIIVTNWHKIIDSNTVRKYLGKLINLHYSLLPAFAGVIGDVPIKSALDKGCKFVGTTVHYVDEIVDNGKIIGQTVTKVPETLDFSCFMDEIFRAGCFNLLNCILKITHLEPSHDEVLFENGVLINPGISFRVDCFGVDFWGRIKGLK
jgi:phosphoribosylglycinamide formyltransferase-1